MDHTGMTEQELRAFAEEHLLYEVDMMRETLKVRETLSQPDSSLATWATNNALLESAVLHARNLIDFLYPRDTARSGDVTARDFFDPTDLRDRSAPSVPKALTEMRRRADKELSHLTVHRISGTPVEKEWPIGWFNELDRRLRTFARLASPHRLGDKPKSRILD
jgi:hypothetical protein